MRDPPVIVRTRHVSVPVPNGRATRWLYGTATSRIVTTGEALRDRLVRDNGLDPARVDSIPTGIDAARFGEDAYLLPAPAHRGLGVRDRQRRHRAGGQAPP